MYSWSLFNRRLVRLPLYVLLAIAVLSFSFILHADSKESAPIQRDDTAAMLDAYRHVEVASVSDAAEQLLHQRRYMSHRMRPIFPAKFAGIALTVKIVKAETTDPKALDGMLKAIDTGSSGSVYVMQVEDGADIAGMGGLMGTAMYFRGFSGAVIDGGVRDLPQLKRIGFPVFALGPVPSTAVGHYRFAGMNVPIHCDGVDVMPGDIIVADDDGVVAVPRAQAAAVLQLAQKLDYTEHSTYPYIEKFHSIVEAVRQFGRI
jgi:regulator of RNase E activity RraA